MDCNRNCDYSGTGDGSALDFGRIDVRENR